MLSALQKNSNLKQLGLQSMLEECLQAHVDTAHPSISMIVNCLPYKTNFGENNPSKTLKDVYTVMFSPTKTAMAAPVPQHAAPTVNLADRMQLVADGTPVARLPPTEDDGTARHTGQTPSVHDSGVKLLIDQSKFSATAGPVVPFLKSIIACQTDLFKSHIEQLGNKHPVNLAIINCDLSTFRDEFETLFNKTFPRDQRKRCLVSEISGIEYVEDTMSLLDLRTIAFQLKRRIDDLFEGEAFIAQKDAMTAELSGQLMHVIKHIKNFDIRSEIKDHFTGKGESLLTFDLITHALRAADETLRDRDTSYPLKQRSIPVHSAVSVKPQRQFSGPPCAACKVIWGYDNFHSVEECHSNPINAATRGEQVKYRIDRYVKKHGKHPPTFDWTKKRSVDPSAKASPPKRGGGAGAM